MSITKCYDCGSSETFASRRGCHHCINSGGTGVYRCGKCHEEHMAKHERVWKEIKAQDICIVCGAEGTFYDGKCMDCFCMPEGHRCGVSKIPCHKCLGKSLNNQ